MVLEVKAEATEEGVLVLEGLDGLTPVAHIHPNVRDVPLRL